MRVLWDEGKRELVLAKRKIDFLHLHELLCLPHIEDRRVEDPEQYRIIGFVRDVLTTFIVEYREDDEGELMWVVTAWRSTRAERKAYEQETK